MTHHAIIERLYNSPDLDDCIKKTVRPDHQKDFKHELILLLYEKPQELILNLYNTSGLTYYVVRIILNLVNQKRNVYHRTYNDSTVTYDTDKVTMVNRQVEPEDFSEREKRELKELALLNEIENNLDDKEKFPYYRELIEAINTHGGIRAASRITGIPKSSIHDTVKKIRQRLNKIYDDPEQIKGIY